MATTPTQPPSGFAQTVNNIFGDAKIGFASVLDFFDYGTAIYGQLVEDQYSWKYIDQQAKLAAQQKAGLNTTPSLSSFFTANKDAVFAVVAIGIVGAALLLSRGK